MNRYLTAKAQKTRWWNIPIAAISLMMLAIALTVWIRDGDAEDFVISLLAHATVTELVGWPFFHAVSRGLRKRQAREIARRLAQHRESSLPLAGLDAALGVKNAARKIAALTQGGFLQLVGVDENAGCLWLGNPEPEAVAPEDARSGFEETILKIRGLNDDIADPVVSEKIDRIEAATAGIFRTVEAQPGHAEAARRFMNYYLPTTLRLLETYRLMEGQSYQGENIRASRRSIEAVLDKLACAIEQQQDKLFRSDALDVEAEIRVLETMMTSDGLTRPGK